MTAVPLSVLYSWSSSSGSMSFPQCSLSSQALGDVDYNSRVTSEIKIQHTRLQELGYTSSALRTYSQTREEIRGAHLLCLL